MRYDLPPKDQWPVPGYYYHYKHDPGGSVKNYAYYILGIGHHTEKDCRPEDQFTMIYQPLYEAYVYLNGRMFDNRPLHMFFEPAMRDGREIQRFTRITDPSIIAELRRVKRAMYPDLDG